MARSEKDIESEIIEMTSESKRTLSGWIVQRFGGASVREFGVKITEEIVKFVPL